METIWAKSPNYDQFNYVLDHDRLSICDQALDNSQRQARLLLANLIECIAGLFNPSWLRVFESYSFIYFGLWEAWRVHKWYKKKGPGWLAWTAVVSIRGACHGVIEYMQLPCRTQLNTAPVHIQPQSNIMNDTWNLSSTIKYLLHRSKSQKHLRSCWSFFFFAVDTCMYGTIQKVPPDYLCFCGWGFAIDSIAYCILNFDSNYRITLCDYHNLHRLWGIPILRGFPTAEAAV